MDEGDGVMINVVGLLMGGGAFINGGVDLLMCRDLISNSSECITSPLSLYV